MGEGGTNPELEENEFGSRFGDKERIVVAMTEGSVIRVGSIEEVCSDVVNHANQVDVYDTPWDARNKILGVEIQLTGMENIRCVFKPASGENELVKKTTMVKDFYPRECAAYIVSEHFGFDVVPPTIIREIGGQLGSLQLFLDHNYYMNLSRVEGEDLDRVDSGLDWLAIAALDWMLANCERHFDNLMVKRSEKSNIVAIDHGIIMSSPNYTEMALRGPSLQMTYDGMADQPKSEPIPDQILYLIKKGLQKKEKLDTRLKDLGAFSEQEMKSFWMRTEALVRHGKFLSKMNHKHVTGISFLGAGY